MDWQPMAMKGRCINCGQPLRHHPEVVWSGVDKRVSLSTVGDGGSSLKLAAEIGDWARMKGQKKDE